MPYRQSNSLWAQVAERFRSDKTGMGALVVVGLFFVLVLCAQWGWVGSDWQDEIGKPFAPPHLVGAKADVQAEKETQAPVRQLDISDIDPLAPYYDKWQQKAAGVAVPNQIKQDTLPWGGDRIGRDVMKKAIKGAQISILVGLTAALMATLIGTVLGAVGGYFGGAVDDTLEWIYNVFNAIPLCAADFCAGSGVQVRAARQGIFQRYHERGRDFEFGGLDGHLPTGTCRVHQAPLTRLCPRC